MLKQASKRQHVYFALFSGFFNIRLLIKVFPTFCIKMSAKSINVSEKYAHPDSSVVRVNCVVIEVYRKILKPVRFTSTRN